MWTLIFEGVKLYSRAHVLNIQRNKCDAKIYLLEQLKFNPIR